MARFDDRSESPLGQTRATVPEPDSSRFRFSEKMRLIQKAAELVLPALIEHIGKVNECSQTHEPKWEPKWTQFDIQNAFLLLQERKWPLTTKNFSDAFSHSTGSEDETLNQITSPSSDLSPRVIAVRDAIVDCFSDLLKDSSPISDCFHGDGAASEHKHIYALFEQVLRDLSGAAKETPRTGYSDLPPQSPIDTAAATASIEHTLYRRWARILWESAATLSSMKTPVYDPPSALSQLHDVVQKLIHGGDDS